MKKITGLLLLVLLFAQGCANPSLTPGEGFIQVSGGPVWYRIFGAGNATPVLMVHGGPGIRSCYFERLAVLLSKNRPVILYDQLGSGRSGRPMDTSLWTVGRFVQELVTVREMLHLNKVHLLGHSWGTALVAEYLIKTQPEGIASVTMASPYFSTRQWAEDANYRRTELPAEILKVLETHEQNGTFQSKEYQDATQVYNNRFLFHNKPAPIPSCAQAPRNNEIYEQMWGPTDFYSTGVLKDYDISPRIPELKMPMLFITGRYDTARPETAAKYQAMAPGAQLVILENSAHMGAMEEPEKMSEALESFVEQVEAQADH
ncbi:MAG: alpha/beta fold hydrolase [Methylococcaceae bacterium]|nr:MAG: alpha/beta fold hydrolase [Methylococcaceae bacterium]